MLHGKTVRHLIFQRNHCRANLLRPLDFGDIGVTFLDSSFKVRFCTVKVNIALEVIAECVLNQFHTALVIGGQRCNLNIFGNRGEIFIRVLTAKEVGDKRSIGGSFLHTADRVGKVQIILGDFQQVFLVCSQRKNDVLDMFGVVSASCGMDVGATPVYS